MKLRLNNKRKLIVISISVLVLFLTLMFATFSVDSDWNANQILQIQNQPVSDNFCFAAMGDNRGSFDEFPQIISQLDEQYVFAINGGDLVSYGTFFEYALFHFQIKKSEIPYLNVVGNHDITNRGRTIFEKTYGPVNYAFSYADTKFIAIDNAEENITKQTFDWLVTELEDDFENKIVFMHVPPFDPRYNDKVGHGMEQSAAELMIVMEENNVDMVVASHIHGYEEAERNGIQYVITGGAGAPLHGAGIYHYVQICVKDSKFSWEVIKL